MGWNGSGEGEDERSTRSKKPMFSTGTLRLFGRLAIVGIVAITGGIAAWIMLGRSGAPVNDSRNVSTKQIPRGSIPVAEMKTSRPLPLAFPESYPQAEGANSVWANTKGLDSKLFPYEDGRKVVKTRTNGWMAVDICIMPNGVRRKVRRHTGKQLFRFATDEVLLQALSTGDDEVGPPIPFSEDMEDDFRRSLMTPITIDDDDTPEQRKIKELVSAARECVVEQMNEGRSFFDAVSDHVATQESNQSARETVMSAVEELKANGESDLINTYLRESNKVLEGMGASPILKSDIEEDPNGELNN